MMSSKAGKGRSFLLSAVILLSAVGVLVLLVATRHQTQPVAVKEKAWPVTAMTLEPGRWPRTLTLYARVDALARSSLVAALSADVAAVAVKEGDRVHKGQLLVLLDDSDYRLDLQQREAEVAQAEAAIEEENSRHQGNLEALPGERRLLQLAQAEVNRLQGLVGKKLTSQSNLDSARQTLARQSIAVARIEESIRTHASKLKELQARLRQKQAALEKARLQLQRTRVTAPYDGRVLQVKVAAGQRVNPGGQLLQLFDERSLVLRAVVPENRLALLQQMQAAGEKVSASGRLDGRVLTGVLAGLTASVDDSGAGVAALFRLDARSRWPALGRVLRIRVSLPPVEGVVPIPYEALYGLDEVYLVAADHRLHRVKVERAGELHREGRDRLLVRLPPDARGLLLTTQLPNAVEGLLVKVVQRD